MRGLRHPYLWGRDHPLVVDGLLAVGLLAMGVLTEVVSEPEAQYAYHRDPDGIAFLLMLAATLPLAVRRRRPLAVHVVVFAAAALYYDRMYVGGGPMFGVLVSLYSVAAHASRRVAAYALAGSLAIQMVAMALFPNEGDSWIAALAVGGVQVAAWVIGDNLRVRRAYVAAVEDRAEQLEREQDAQARRAVLEERNRIARELHDIVAHSMSVMVVQAGAARRTLDRDPELAVEAIGQIEATGRDALAEMRRVVAVLRQDMGRHPDRAEPLDLPRPTPTWRVGVADATQGGRAGSGGGSFDRDTLVPQPGLDQLPALVAQCCEAGLPVELHVGGSRRPLPSGVELTVYRIVQEALTNTMRHAGPARAVVALRYGRRSIKLSVSDDGRGAAAGPDGEPETAGRRSTGHGLAGMHERVALYGGHLVARPRQGGGWIVAAEIPLRDEARSASPATADDQAAVVTEGAP